MMESHGSFPFCLLQVPSSPPKVAIANVRALQACFIEHHRIVTMSDCFVGLQLVGLCRSGSRVSHKGCLPERSRSNGMG